MHFVTAHIIIATIFRISFFSNFRLIPKEVVIPLNSALTGLAYGTAANINPISPV